MADNYITIKKCPQCNSGFTGNEVVCPEDLTMLLAPQKDELIGQILNERYKVESEYGRGERAAVYKGSDELGRTYAIKCFLPEFCVDNVSVKEFIREAQTICTLNHPGLIKIHERR